MRVKPPAQVTAADDGARAIASLAAAVEPCSSSRESGSQRGAPRGTGSQPEPRQDRPGAFDSACLDRPRGEVM